MENQKVNFEGGIFLFQNQNDFVENSRFLFGKELWFEKNAVANPVGHRLFY